MDTLWDVKAFWVFALCWSKSARLWEGFHTQNASWHNQFCCLHCLCERNTLYMSRVNNHTAELRKSGFENKKYWRCNSLLVMFIFSAQKLEHLLQEFRSLQDTLAEVCQKWNAVIVIIRSRVQKNLLTYPLLPLSITLTVFLFLCSDISKIRILLWNGTTFNLFYSSVNLILLEDSYFLCILLFLFRLRSVINRVLEELQSLQRH